jgi:hypothetical protein
MNTVQLDGETNTKIKAAAAAAATAAGNVAPKGTKLPVQQWTKRAHFEAEGTKQLRDLLAQGFVVTSIGKPLKAKDGTVSGVAFKIGAAQCALEAKVQGYVAAQMNARARRKAKREAAAAAKAAQAPAAPIAPVVDATAALSALAATLPSAKAA